MKKIFGVAALAIGISGAASVPVAAQSLPCEDYQTVMRIFEEQGTVYRGRAEGPNHRLLEIFENVPTGRGAAILHDLDNDRACMVSFGFDFAAFSRRAQITNTP